MEKEISNIILGIAGPQDRFTLKYGWFRFRLSIKPITARQLIAISGEVSKLKAIDETKEMFPALMTGITDIKYIAKAVAIATGTRYKRIITRAIMKLPLKDVCTLFSIVQKQADPSFFFHTIILAKGRMNLLKAKPE